MKTNIKLFLVYLIFSVLSGLYLQSLKPDVENFYLVGIFTGFGFYVVYCLICDYLLKNDIFVNYYKIKTIDEDNIKCTYILKELKYIGISQILYDTYVIGHNYDNRVKELFIRYLENLKMKKSFEKEKIEINKTENNDLLFQLTEKMIQAKVQNNNELEEEFFQEILKLKNNE